MMSKGAARMLDRLWLRKIIFSPGEVLQLTSIFGAAGLVLSTAVLTVAILTVNGFSMSLQKIVVNRNGHLVFASENKKSVSDFLKKLKPYRSAVHRAVPFLSFEGLIANSRQLKGVVFEGVDFELSPSDSGIQKKIVQAAKNLNSEKPFVILGRHLAGDLKTDLGGKVQAVVLKPSESEGFARKKKSFSVQAVIDFGKHDLNSRYVLMPLKSAFEFVGEDRISGLRIYLKDEALSDRMAQILNYQYRESGYQAASWMSLEKSFFENINSDKRIIFFVLLILIFAAGFNISSSLFAQVFKKTKDISILKAMGAKNSFILRIFLLRGLVLGAPGSGLGVLFGLLVFRLLIVFQKTWNLLPEEVYQINEIVLNWNPRDLILIFISSLIAVLAASVLPALRACRIPVKEGLTYE